MRTSSKNVTPDSEALDSKTQDMDTPGSAARQPGVFSRFCYRIIYPLVWLFHPKMQTVGLENLPNEPCILVGNHSQMYGPISGEIFFPHHDRKHLYIWCTAEMMHLKEVPAYAYQDFWSGKPVWIRWLYRIASYLIAPISVCIFTNANTIPVYRDRRVLDTIKETCARLSEGHSVLIFPECYTPHNQIVHEFQEGFVDTAKRYWRASGKAVCFVPLYIAPKLRRMYVGQPVRYDPSAPAKEERQRICEAMMDGITQIATSLPRHRVVPYPNISKRDYPYNTSEADPPADK